jgi:hypothetical protein
MVENNYSSMVQFLFSFQTTLERETVERQNERSGWRAEPVADLSDLFPGSCLFSKEKFSTV